MQHILKDRSRGSGLAEVGQPVLSSSQDPAIGRLEYNSSRVGPTRTPDVCTLANIPDQVRQTATGDSATVSPANDFKMLDIDRLEGGALPEC